MLPNLRKLEDLLRVNGSAEGQGVDCPPLGPSGQWSSPERKTDLSVLCTHCTDTLLTQ